MRAARAIRSCALVIGIVAGFFASTGGPAAATFPGRNGLIAFDTVGNFDIGRARSDIFTVEPDGSHLRRLTDTPRGFESSSPDWSPDGRRILFIENSSYNAEIWVMNADGSNKRQITFAPDFDDLDPTWAPDGSHLAFSRCSFQGRCKLMTMRLDGTGRHKVLGGNWQYFGAQYSPDGTQIVFDSTRGGLQSAVWIVGIDGTGLQRLTRPRLEAFYPDWSPDGQHILFTDFCCRAKSNIWVMRTDGSRQRRITSFAGGHQGAFATYSPSGRKIVLWSDLAHDDGCCNDVYVMRVDGSGLHRVTTAQPGVLRTDWGPRR